MLNPARKKQTPLDAPPARAVQADIPPTRHEREDLLRVIQSYVLARNPTPPLSAGELRMHADSIVKGAGVNEAYRKYVTVLINNEAWRDTLAGIPFNRRLLLLPRCFRAEGRCTAAVDQFGLNCRHCGACAIDELTNEAERLGYVVLVAEGSAAVTAIIESRKLEAIVGVSCLSVLENVFPHMEAAAIPGVAVPLLYDGCRETAADFDAVWDAIHLSGDDKCRRLNLDQLRRQVDTWFAPESIRELLGPPTGETERIAQDWLAKSGKRWRPFLVACTYSAFSDPSRGDTRGQPQTPASLPADLARLGMAVECFHKASLIHDDIEDNDRVRYGEATLHEQFGVPVALNVGDFLLGEGYRMIASANVPADRKAAMLAVAIAGHRLLCLGQGEELSWMRRPRPLLPAEVLAIFRHKTAPAFEVALRLGAIFAGAGEDVKDVLSQYSAFFGIAYQIQDDLDDFAPHPDQPSDAHAMRPSLLMSIAHELATGPDRVLVEDLWRQPALVRRSMAEVERILARLNVRETTTQLLESYKAEAIRSLSPLDNASLKGLLRRVIGRIFNDAELKGWCRELFPEADHEAGRQRGGEPAA
ncbi:MAG: polyprenyl synthetase family protein [Phycisphaerae bacterium]|nr:polyprenyl synthetase family protein [Phycisphaerae bacterium]